MFSHCPNNWGTCAQQARWTTIVLGNPPPQQGVSIGLPARGVNVILLGPTHRLSPRSLPDLLLLCMWKPGIRRSPRRAPKISAVLSASITPNTNATWSTTLCCTEVTFWAWFSWDARGGGRVARVALEGSCLKVAATPFPQSLVPSLISPKEITAVTPVTANRVRASFCWEDFLHLEGGKGDGVRSEHFCGASPWERDFTSRVFCSHDLAKEGVNEKQSGWLNSRWKVKSPVVVSSSLKEDQNDDLQSRKWDFPWSGWRKFLKLKVAWYMLIFIFLIFCATQHVAS